MARNARIRADGESEGDEDDVDCICGNFDGCPKRRSIRSSKLTITPLVTTKYQDLSLAYLPLSAHCMSTLKKILDYQIQTMPSYLTVTLEFSDQKKRIGRIRATRDDM